MAADSIMDMFKTITISNVKYEDLIIAEEKYNELIELLEQYRRCGKDLKNEELTLILQLIHNKKEIGGCEFEKDCQQRFEKENEEALVQGVEAVLDYGGKVPPEDMEKYIEITGKKEAGKVTNNSITIVRKDVVGRR